MFKSVLSLLTRADHKQLAGRRRLVRKEKELTSLHKVKGLRDNGLEQFIKGFGGLLRVGSWSSKHREIMDGKGCPVRAKYTKINGQRLRDLREKR